MSTDRPFEVSAPGKVLICGGYVVLNGGHSLVLSTDSRFTSDLIATAKEEGGIDIELAITVSSPQFGKQWNYICSWHYASRGVAEAFKFYATDSAETGANPYVENALFYAFCAAAAHSEMSTLKPGRFQVRVTILADNNFYSHSKSLKSQGISPTQENLRKVQPYAPLGSSITKTGLGSSAALVSSLTACVMAWAFNWVRLDDHLHFAHNVAQVAHCQAQGKIGSGFDVASAFFGSQHYIRFSRDPIDAVMKAYATYQSDATQIDALLKEIAAQSTKMWMKSHPERVALPRGLTMVLGECGKDMNTPTSVKLVLDWAANNKQESDALFEKLSSNNLFIMETFNRLEKESLENAQSYDETLQQCKLYVAREWADKVSDTKTRGYLLQLQEAFKNQRGMMKQLGVNAGTPVEPDEITEVLDETEQKQAGVLATGAPGAGGYDAVFTLLVDASLIPQLESLWMNHAALPMSCLTTRENSSGAILRAPSKGCTTGTCPFSVSSPLLVLTVGAAMLGYLGVLAYRHFSGRK